jgi:CHRD domain-containing protein
MSAKLSQVALAAVFVAGTYAYAHAAEKFSASMNGFEETGGLGTGQTGAILTPGQGELSLKLQGDSISYTLKYSDLSSAAAQAHIHFGKIHVSGGIIAFLCTNLGNGPAGTPTCPETGGTVTGVLTAGSIVGPTAQNVAIGNFGALLDALDSDTAYVNLHTTNFGSGEIRGQIRHDNRRSD